MKRIGDFELIDHGIEHSQHFQGCGVAFTCFENVVTGIGDNPAEAIDNCFEQMAQLDFDVSGLELRIMEQEDIDCIPHAPSVTDEMEDADDMDNEFYYHVSIRWNEKKGDTP